MRNAILASSLFIACGFSGAAWAAGTADMIGKWKWTDYTVECKEGGANGISCLVVDGPKNKGMEMVQSKLEGKDGAFTGDIKHPATGEIYKTKLTLKNADTWSMDGCTAANVCAKGDFVRVK